MNGDRFSTHRSRPALIVAVWVMWLLLAAGTLHADATAAPEEQGPEPSESPVPGVGVEERLGETLPDLPFYNEQGERVTLHEYLGTKKPVLLTLNYYRCPMLCDLVLNDVARSISQLSLVPGENYEVVTISFDPAETASMARDKKASYLRQYANTVPGIEEGWHFLTGEKQHIEAVADAVGYGFAWIESRKQYAHPAVVMIITPEGKISRYLYYGRQDPTESMRLSLVEASDGKIGSIFDQILLTCFSFDPNAGKYTWEAMALMRIGGVLTVGFLLAAVAGFLVWDHRRHKSHDAEAAPTGRPE